MASKWPSKTREYFVWEAMLRRCANKNTWNYKRYGGRGICVCSQWKGRGGFARFITDVGKRPSPTHVLDRIDNNGNYEPGNCRWVTKKQSARNRRSNLLIRFQNVTRTLAEWAELIGIKLQTLWARIRLYGWSVRRAFTVQPRFWGNR